MNLNDKVFIIQDGVVYGRSMKQCATIIAGTVDFITSNEVTVKVLTETGESLLIPVLPDRILNTPQKALEAIQHKVFNITETPSIKEQEEN